MVVEELKLPKINVDVGLSDEPMTKKGDEKVIETDRGNDVNQEDQKMEEEKKEVEDMAQKLDNVVIEESKDAV